jgi:glycosyltransferase involved in cell wall biosynthesis
LNSQTLKVLEVTAGLAKSTGGPSYSIPSLCNSLARLQVDCSLLTTRDRGEQTAYLDPQLVKHINVERFPVLFLNVTWAPGFGSKIKQLCREEGFQLIHNHGVWLHQNHAASRAAADLKLPLVHSPRGMLTLQQMGYRALKKRLAWLLYQKKDLESARVVHVTAENEADDLRALGYTGPLAVIPNGVDIPPWVEKETSSPGFRTALFFSRIHPKKGLPNLVEAWARVRPAGWRMRIVGPDLDGHRAQVEALVREKGLEDVFRFEDPVYGEARWDLLRAADLFILPTLSENFGIAVPEALACGVPVITTEGAPWAGIKENDCGWWVPIGVEPLAAALREATEAADSQRRAMGRRGRSWVEKSFTWESAALKMKSLYGWILGGGAVPSFVRMD